MCFRPIKKEKKKKRRVPPFLLGEKKALAWPNLQRPRWGSERERNRKKGKNKKRGKKKKKKFGN